MIKNIFLHGENYKIYSKYHKSSKETKSFLLLHSNVYAGGSINDLIIKDLFDYLASNDFNVIAVDFSKNPNVLEFFEEEIVAANVGLDYLSFQNGNTKIKDYCVIGFDFGAYIGSKIIERRWDVNSFIFINPPINKYDFKFFTKLKIQGNIICSKEDKITPQKEMDKFISECQKYNTKINHKILDLQSHFLENKKDSLLVIKCLEDILHNN